MSENKVTLLFCSAMLFVGACAKENAASDVRDETPARGTHVVCEGNEARGVPAQNADLDVVILPSATHHSVDGNETTAIVYSFLYVDSSGRKFSASNENGITSVLGTWGCSPNSLCHFEGGTGTVQHFRSIKLTLQPRFKVGTIVLNDGSNLELACRIAN